MCLQQRHLLLVVFLSYSLRKGAPAHMRADSFPYLPWTRVSKVPCLLLHSDGVAAKNNSKHVAVGLDVAAENAQVYALLVAEPPLLDTGNVRVRSLLLKCRAANHNNHRRKSPWTELASQSTKNGVTDKG